MAFRVRLENYLILFMFVLVIVGIGFFISRKDPVKPLPVTKHIGFLQSMGDQVLIKRQNEDKSHPASAEYLLKDDIIYTGADSSARVDLSDGSFVQMAADTIIKIRQLKEEPEEYLIELVKGSIKVDVNQPNSQDIKIKKGDETFLLLKGSVSQIFGDQGTYLKTFSKSIRIQMPDQESLKIRPRKVVRLLPEENKVEDQSELFETQKVVKSKKKKKRNLASEKKIIE